MLPTPHGFTIDSVFLAEMPGMILPHPRSLYHFPHPLSKWMFSSFKIILILYLYGVFHSGHADIQMIFQGFF